MPNRVMNSADISAAGGALQSALASEITARADADTSIDGRLDPVEAKLAGIASGATANQTDAYLLSRVNHTGSQAISTVTGLQSALDSKATPADIAASAATLQPLDADLTSLSAASVTGVLYYRSGAGAWSPVTIGSNLTFAGGTLSASGGGGGVSPPFAISDTTGLQTALDGKQPLDSDLTAIAALTTTAYGRGLLELANAAALKTSLTLTKSDVGLANVDNTSDAAKPVSTATQTALDLKAPTANPTFTGTVSGVTKAHVGLGNVDNTSDAAKPVSTAQQAAIDAAKPVEFITVALSDETTDITTGAAKVTMRMPYAFTLTGVRASLSTASSSGLPTVNIKEGGVAILSTKVTIDATEKTSTTAATPPVISDPALADDAEITFDVDVAGTGARGLKVTLIGRRT